MVAITEATLGTDHPAHPAGLNNLAALLTQLVRTEDSRPREMVRELAELIGWESTNGLIHFIDSLLGKVRGRGAAVSTVDRHHGGRIRQGPSYSDLLNLAGLLKKQARAEMTCLANGALHGWHDVVQDSTDPIARR